MRDEGKLMDCVQFREIYHELDRSGTSGFIFRERALAHAEACAGCGALLTDGEALDFALRNLAQQRDGSVASPRVEAALLREFQRVKHVGQQRRIYRQLAILSTAAVILLALGLGVHYRIVSKARNTPPQVASTVVKPAAETPVISATPASPNSSKAALASNTQSKPASVNPPDDNEYAEEFVPLPYADDPAALEGGAIVRVTLPRSALASFGLPLTESDGTDRVAADLVVSQDGTPQAIRLVSQATPNSEF
jgi:hypothetical protein